MKEIRVSSVISKSKGVKKGTLRAGTLPDGMAMDIPVIVVRGAKEGPVLWLHGCVHGNEYCGTFIIHEFLRKLDWRKLAGSVVALPVLNVTAFQKNQRMSPFEGFNGGDLNRCFPGDAGGTLTLQMAHAIYQPLKRYADCLVDFHTAMTDDVRWALFANVGGKAGKLGEKIARAFGYKSTLPAPPDILAGSAMMAAAKDGIGAMIVECGGKGPAFDDDAVADGAERLRNVCRSLNMLPGKAIDHGPLHYFSNFAWCYSTQGGLFEKSVKCGHRLAAGQTIGRYFDLFGQPAGEAKSTHAGIVLAIHPGPVMAAGETLVHVGLDPKEV